MLDRWSRFKTHFFIYSNEVKYIRVTVTVTLSCVITEKILYLNLLNILVDCNLSFTRSLNFSYFEWIIFIRLKIIKAFLFSFSSLTLHVVNLLHWNKILSLTNLKIITASRPSTFTRVFPMGRSRSPFKRQNSASVGYQPPLPLPHLRLSPGDVFSVTQSRLIWKNLMELFPLIQNSVSTASVTVSQPRHLPSY